MLLQERSKLGHDELNTRECYEETFIHKVLTTHFYIKHLDVSISRTNMGFSSA